MASRLSRTLTSNFAILFLTAGRELGFALPFHTCQFRIQGTQLVLGNRFAPGPTNRDIAFLPLT